MISEPVDTIPGFTEPIDSVVYVMEFTKKTKKQQHVFDVCLLGLTTGSEG